MDLRVPELITVQLLRVQHQEEEVLVDLDLGPLTSVERVLDGEGVEGELLLKHPELRLGGILDVKPDERTVLGHEIADASGVDVLLGDHALAVEVAGERHAGSLARVGT